MLVVEGAPRDERGGIVVAPDAHAPSRELREGRRLVLDLIASARRLKMAVRGWVAEEHLVRMLRKVRARPAHVPGR